MAAEQIIREKLESLLKGVNENYGKILTNELLLRLENAIKDFNEEVVALLNDLKENASLKEKMMEEIKEGKLDEDTSAEITQTEESDNMSQWEKRLESLSN